MDNVDAQYLFMNDFREWIKSGKAGEIIDDLRRYFPEEYNTFMREVKKEEKATQVAALLRASTV